MPIPQTTQQRIIQAITTRAGAVICPMCRTGPWTLIDGYISISVGGAPGEIVLGGQTLPCVGLVCTTCGYTAYFNMIVLGLQDLLSQDVG